MERKKKFVVVGNPGAGFLRAAIITALSQRDQIEIIDTEKERGIIITNEPIEYKINSCHYEEYPQIINIDKADLSKLHPFSKFIGTSKKNKRK